MNWIARRLAAWLAPYIIDEIRDDVSCTPHQIDTLKQCALAAVENGVIARHAVEELANALGYEVVFSGADTVQILPLKQN